MSSRVYGVQQFLRQTTPSHVDGVLTVYSGDRISLKCSHNNLMSGVTRWSFTAPLSCSEAIIDHNPPITTSPYGQFTFQDVTEIMLGRLLNSTAVATATSVMSGAVVECRDSTGLAPNLIGRVTLCVTGRSRSRTYSYTCLGAIINI